MVKNGVSIRKKDDKISFYGHSEKYGCNYLYTKPFTKGEWIYFSKAKSLNELHSFREWGKNPRLDKIIKKVLRMYKYVEKEQREEVEDRDMGNMDYYVTTYRLTKLTYSFA